MRERARAVVAGVPPAISLQGRSVTGDHLLLGALSRPPEVECRRGTQPKAGSGRSPAIFYFGATNFRRRISSASS